MQKTIRSYLKLAKPHRSAPGQLWRREHPQKNFVNFRLGASTTVKFMNFIAVQLKFMNFYCHFSRRPPGLVGGLKFMNFTAKFMNFTLKFVNLEVHEL